MQNPEKLCIKWNDFQDNLNSAFGVLRNDQDFTDVTLSCEDGTQIEAHKVVLTSSSPFFMEMLKKNKHPHPMIFMRGLKAEMLGAMVDFLYQGEASVNQGSLDVFLALAEELRLKGLAGLSAETNSDEEFRNKIILPKSITEVRQHQVKLNSANVYNSKVKREPSSAALVSVGAVDQLDEQIKSMMNRTDNELIMGARRVKAFACAVCGKEGQQGNIKTHIEANHIDETISHSCDICGKISRSRHRLILHKSKEHFK